MKETENPYVRLQEYFYVMKGIGMSQSKKTDCFRVRLSDLAETVSLPMEIVRSDIVCFMEVLNNDYSLILKKKDVLEKYETQEGFDWRAFRSDMTKGMYDHAELEWTVFDEDRVMLPLTPEESSVMEQVLHEHYYKKGDISAPFLIKDSYHFTFLNEEEMNETLYDIRTAIEDHKEIKIRDLAEKGRPVRVVKPVKLFYDTTENLYAVICIWEEGLCAYRIDKIEFLGTGKSFIEPNDIEKRLSVVPNVWGLAFSDKPMKVKVRILAKHSRGNVGKKARKDLERRINGQLYENGDDLIYEDKVYGKDSFLRWLFGYGASAVLEKPIALRKEILEMLEREVKKM